MTYGMKSNIALTFQNSFDSVGDVSSGHFIPFLSEALALKIPPKYSENMRGVFDEGDTYEGPRMVEGDINCEAQIVPAGAMLKAMFAETIVNSDSLYTRTFKPRQSDWDEKSANHPVTVYKYLDTGSAMQYYNLNAATMEINIAQGEFLQMTAGFVGGAFQQVANVAASLPTGKRFTWNVASLSVDGSALGNLMDLTITVDDGALEATHTLNNSKYPSRVKRTGFRTIAVEGTIKFDNQDEYQQFLSQSERKLVAHFEGPTEIQSGYNEGLTIQLPALRYEEFEPAAGGPGQIEVGITARGKYHVGSGSALEITHYSDQAAY